MKKILFLLLTILLVFSLTACDNINKILESFNADDLIENLGGNTKKNSSGEGEGEGEGGQTETIQTAEQSQTVLYSLGLSKGFEITFKINESESTTIGYKDNIMWINTEDSSSVYKNEGGSLVHIFEMEEDDYQYCGTLETEFEEMYKAFSSTIFSTAAIYQSREFTKKGTEEVAGYKCNVYTSTYAYLNNYATIDVYADSETGLIFKIYVEESAEGEKESGILLEVTEFKTGETINVPQVEVPEETTTISSYGEYQPETEAYDEG